MIVDSHCHLDYPGLAEDEAAVIARAREAGVGAMLSISTKMSTFDRLEGLAQRHDDVFCTVGVHPHHAGDEGLADEKPLLAKLKGDKVIGVGESGLDYHYDFAPRDAQKKSFKAHIRACQISGLPLVVHTREADADTMDILQEALRQDEFGGVIHCYSSSRELAIEAIARGFYLGIGGILTFKRSDELRATIADVPPECLLVETDSPYLSPVPMRKMKTNEPANTVHVVRKLSEVIGLSFEDTARITTENFYRLFAKAAPEPVESDEEDAPAEAGASSGAGPVGGDDAPRDPAS